MTFTREIKDEVSINFVTLLFFSLPKRKQEIEIFYFWDCLANDFRTLNFLKGDGNEYTFHQVQKDTFRAIFD